MPRKRKGNPVHGWLVLDKPKGLTSTQCVGKVRRLFNAQKVGHGGTLDPLATGILPIALGEATKTVPFIMDARKAYSFTLTWGQSTDTLDAEGEVIAQSDVRPNQSDVQAQLPSFIGDVVQIPPKYSAIKIDGKRAYDLARAGHDVDIKSRRVRIDSLDLTDWTPAAATFEMRCGKGTYVRSVARDLAEQLGACGHVTVLRRLQVGGFTLSRAFSLDALEELCHRGRVLESLLPIEAPLDDIPVVNLDQEQAEHLKHGRQARSPSTLKPTDALEQPDRVLAKFEGFALAICDVGDGYLIPKRVFNM